VSHVENFTLHYFDGIYVLQSGVFKIGSSLYYSHIRDAGIDFPHL